MYLSEPQLLNLHSIDIASRGEVVVVRQSIAGVPYRVRGVHSSSNHCSTDLAPFHALVVEDSDLTTEAICDLIRRFRSTAAITAVATEKNALAALAETTPHVVVLDLRLKQGSGFGVLRKIAALRPKPFVVVATNYALPPYREYALLAGADYFLDKAINLEALPTILESFENPQAAQ